VTDSGGVQEEAPSLDVPVLVMRDNTERPEGVDAGCAALCGTEPRAMVAEIDRLLTDASAYRAMAVAPSPYGDGRAAERIADRLAADLGVRRRVFGAAAHAQRRAAAALELDGEGLTAA
jgi:UDP-N-acetylglucosamine 2-epimerase (non-hydrolysing)